MKMTARDEVLAEVDRLAEGGAHAKTFAVRIRAPLLDGEMPTWELIKSLSSWCHTDGQYLQGREPARAISRYLYDGRVLPRLTTRGGDNVSNMEARARYAEFLRGEPETRSGDLPTWPPSRPTLRPHGDVLPVEPRLFPVFGAGLREIKSVADWFAHAPPKGGEAQWRDLRSAKELARRWCVGRVPGEVLALLDTSPEFQGFRADRATAELRTRIDALPGNTRNHDLVVVGSAGGARAVLDIEGKADEPFGNTLGQAARLADQALTENPRSGAAQRIRQLCPAVLGAELQDVEHLRYQLVFGAAAAVNRAKLEGAARVAFVAHEFRSQATSPHKLKVNDSDLQAFVRQLGGDPSRLANGLVGPFRLPGNLHVSSDVDLFIGKAVFDL